MRTTAFATLASLALAASPSAAWAFGAGAGCADLPEQYRAIGALEGMTGACDMTVERARQILGQDGGQAPGHYAANGGVATGRSVAPAAHPRHRHHRVTSPQM